MSKGKQGVILKTYERVSFHAIANKLFNAAPTLNTNEVNQSMLAASNVPVGFSGAVDIWSVVAVTPEKNVATVRMFVKFCEERCCSWFIADTPRKMVSV